MSRFISGALLLLRKWAESRSLQYGYSFCPGGSQMWVFAFLPLHLKTPPLDCTQAQNAAKVYRSGSGAEFCFIRRLQPYAQRTLTKAQTENAMMWVYSQVLSRLDNPFVHVWSWLYFGRPSRPGSWSHKLWGWGRSPIKISIITFNNRYLLSVIPSILRNKHLLC